MHCYVGLSILHRDFEFLDKKALAADFLQASVENLVAASGQWNERDIELHLSQLFGDMFSLPECQRTFSRCNSNRHYVMNPSVAAAHPQDAGG
jgi:hypothetical protein